MIRVTCTDTEAIRRGVVPLSLDLPVGTEVVVATPDDGDRPGVVTDTATVHLVDTEDREIFARILVAAEASWDRDGLTGPGAEVGPPLRGWVIVDDIGTVLQALSNDDVTVIRAADDLGVFTLLRARIGGAVVEVGIHDHDHLDIGGRVGKVLAEQPAAARVLADRLGQPLQPWPDDPLPDRTRWELP